MQGTTFEGIYHPLPVVFTNFSPYLQGGLLRKKWYKWRGHQLTQQGANAMDFAALQLALQTVLELLSAQRGLPVQHQRNLALRLQRVDNMPAQAQRNGARYAKAGEHQLAKRFSYRPAIGGGGQLYVAQRQIAEAMLGKARNFDGRQRGAKGRDAVPQLFCPSVAISGGAGGRVGKPAGGQQQLFALRRARGPLVAKGNRKQPIAALRNACHLRMAQQLYARAPRPAG